MPTLDFGRRRGDQGGVIEGREGRMMKGLRDDGEMRVGERRGGK